MRIQLTRIGNSRGVRIPQPIIRQCGFGDHVEMRVTPDGLVIAPHYALRQGWKQAFEQEGKPDGVLLEGIPANKFDRKEWKW